MADPAARDVLLARLTMLALQAGIPDDVPASGERWRIGQHASDVSHQVALTQLARLTKPLQCYAEVEDRVIVIVANRMSQRRSSPFKDDFEERFGSDYGDRSMLCVGRDDWLSVTIGEFVEWQETHFCWTAGHGGSADDVPANAREHGHGRGVAYVWTFTPGRGPETVYDRIHITKLPTGAARICSECHERPAMYTVREHESGRPERDFCQRCIDDRMTIQQFDRGRHVTRLQAELAELQHTAPREVLTERAEVLAMSWALHWKPPFVREFIRAYRR